MAAIYQRLWLKRKNTLIYWVLLAIAALLCYYPTRDAGFYADFLGWKNRFDAGSWADVWHSFGYEGHHQLFHAFFYGIYQLAGLNGTIWYIWFVLLHATNAYLVATVWAQLWRLFTAQTAPRWLTAVVALAFLLNPYQTEAVVWKACMHYLLTTCLLLLSLRALLVFAERQHMRWLLLSHLLFAASLFTLELSLSFPLIALIFSSGLALAKKWPWKQWLILVSGVHLLIVASWLWLNRLTLGQWVGHYGADVHLRTDWTLIFGNLFRYLGKYLAYSRHWQWHYKEVFWQLWHQGEWLWPATAIGLAILIYFLWRFRKWHPIWQLSGLTLWAFFAALAPVANLYHAWMLQVENDRYGYFASAFFVMALFSAMAWLGHRFAQISSSLYLLLSLWLLAPTIRHWQEAQAVYASLIADFRWHQSPHVFVLACPDNYNGIFVFKDYSKKSIMVRAAVEALGSKKVSGQIHQVAMFNMNHPDEGVTVRAQADTLTVTLNQWGNWWWHNGIGAANYENEWYRFRKKGRSYQLEWKKKPLQAVWIYSDGPKWRIFDWPDDIRSHE